MGFAPAKASNSEFKTTTRDFLTQDQYVIGRQWYTLRNSIAFETHHLWKTC